MRAAAIAALLLLAAMPALAQTPTPTPTSSPTPTVTPTPTATPAYIAPAVYELDSSFFASNAAWVAQSGFASSTCAAVGVTGCGDGAVIVSTPGAAWLSVAVKAQAAYLYWYADTSASLNVCVNLSTCYTFTAAPKQVSMALIPLPLGVAELYVTATGSGQFGLDRVMLLDHYPTATPAPTATPPGWIVVETLQANGTPIGVAMEYRYEASTGDLAQIIIGVAQLVAMLVILLGITIGGER